MNAGSPPYGGVSQLNEETQTLQASHHSKENHGHQASLHKQETHKNQASQAQKETQLYKALAIPWRKPILQRR